MPYGHTLHHVHGLFLFFLLRWQNPEVYGWFCYLSPDIHALSDSHTWSSLMQFDPALVKVSPVSSSSFCSAARPNRPVITLSLTTTSLGWRTTTITGRLKHLHKWSWDICILVISLELLPLDGLIEVCFFVKVPLLWIFENYVSCSV